MDTFELRFLTESIGDSAAKIKSEAGIVEDIVMFAPPKVGEHYVSARGNHYTKEFFASAARALEGAVIFDQHGDSRSIVKDSLGRFRNVRLVESNGTPKIMGNAHAKPTVKTAFMEAIKQFGDTAGFSIQANTKGHYDDSGQWIHESVADTKRKPSCDLVDCSSATVNVFESVPQTETPKEDAVEIKTVEDLRASYSDLVTQVEKKVRETVTGEFTPKLADAQKQADEYVLLKRKTLVLEKLAASKLPKIAITEKFVALLNGCADEKEIDEQIADRLELVRQTHTGVTGMGAENDADETKKPAALTSDKICEVLVG